ncbi:hypothetical protein AF335_10515 [Streptomyces eurocidicus]|uniref:Uncharacterized protein n=1 Tax=Streptomyces eurocidicus TaxID=66423 RepID=A0A2N8NX41_STREU|nr:hypothetical protein AF335_10515 [Streptomyces eurocidicus]
MGTRAVVGAGRAAGAGNGRGGDTGTDGRAVSRQDAPANQSATSCADGRASGCLASIRSRQSSKAGGRSARCALGGTGSASTWR